MFLGKTSYAVYALHRPVLSIVNGIAQVLHIHLAAFAPIAGVVFLVVLLAACWVIDFAYDQPTRRALARMTAGARPARFASKPETMRG